MDALDVAVAVLNGSNCGLGRRRAGCPLATHGAPPWPHSALPILYSTVRIAVRVLYDDVQTINRLNSHGALGQ
eukprot:411457-Prymnesium_polylepis.1